MADFWDDVGRGVADIAPSIADALGGPLAGKATKLLVKAIGLTDDASPDDVKAAVDAMTPEQQIALKKADHEFWTDLVNAAVQMDANQTDVNKVEAGNSSRAAWFIAGWRPAIGWVCGLAMLWQMVLSPMVFSIINIWAPDAAPFDLDTTAFYTLLTGMLGIAGMRTLEKVQGVAGGELVGLPK